MRRSTYGFPLTFVFSMTLCGGVATAAECDSWQRIAPLITVADLEAVASGPVGLVALGDDGTAFFSPDEVSWRAVPTPIASALNAVAWGSGRFVAVGAGGSIITSVDGRTWNSAESPVSESLFAVTAGPNRWVAVGQDGTVVASDDGLQWQRAAVASDAFLRAVVWRGKEFLAAGSDRVVLSSADGLEWEEHVVDGLTDTVWAMASNGHRTLLAGHYHNYVSDDGRSWSEVADLDGRLIRSVIWTGARFVVLSENGSFAAASDDAVDWSWLGNVFSKAVSGGGMASTEHGLVAVGDAGAIAFLPDGEVSWRLISGPTTVPLEAVAVRDGTTVVVGGDGWPADAVILGGADSMGLVPRYEMSHEKLLDVAATSEGFVAVGGITELLCGPMLMFSPDGVTWGFPPVSSPGADSPCDYFAVAAAGERVVAVGEGKSAASANGGRSWIASAVDDSWGSTDAVATDGEYFVAVGRGGDSFTSTDGLSWEKHVGSIGDGNFASIAWGGGRFVAVSDEGAVRISQDGASWTSGAETVVAEDIIWADERFVAVGGGGLISSSPDGEHWSTTHVEGLQSLRGVAWDGHDLVVAGGWGMVARSTCGLSDTGVVADFTWTPLAVASGLPVRFWDLSAGQVSSRIWGFGDGDWSEDLNPSHSYAASGVYEVELRVSGDGASAASRRVTVLQGPSTMSEQLYLPGVAHLSGFNGARWRTDVEVCAFGGAGEVAIEVSLLLRDQANPDPATVSTTITGGSCRRFRDIVGSLFGVEAAGALRFASERPLIVNGRTYNDTPQGSYGSFKNATAPEDAIGPYEAWLLTHLSQSADPAVGFRSNLSFMNLGEEAIRIEVQLYRSAGDFLGSFDVELAEYEYTQVIRAFLPYAPDGVDDGFAFVQSQDLGARFLAFASLVDNRSGDGASISGQRIEP